MRSSTHAVTDTDKIRDNHQKIKSSFATALIMNTFLLPTDAHNVKNVELLKHSKISKNAP